MDKYIPTVVGVRYGRTYGVMLVELDNCPKCGKYMVSPEGNRWASPFPIYNEYAFDSQIKAAGWVEKSHVKIDDHVICQECASSGRADFECSLCRKRYPSDQVQESFGDPPEFLCQSCYRTVPAKDWESKVEKLKNSHRYDFE